MPIYTFVYINLAHFSPSLSIEKSREEKREIKREEKQKNTGFNPTK